MATLKAGPDYGKISMAQMPGITEVDVRELRDLKLLSAQAFMAAMDAQGGHLENLSQPGAVIEPDQSARLGDLAKEWDKLPEGWRNRWNASTPPPAPVLVPTPPPAPATQPSGWRRLLSGLNPFS